MGFQVIPPYQNAGAAWNQSLMLNVQASEVKVLSMGYEVTHNCFFQEQMKTLHQVTVYESTYKPNVIMFHHVVLQCKGHGVCHLENPDKMYKIINAKDLKTCNNNMSVAEPRNQAEEVLTKCTNMRTTTFPLIVPGRLRSSMQTTGQSAMCMTMTMTSTKRWGEVETCMDQQESPLAHTVQIQ